MTEENFGIIIRGDDYYEMTPARQTHLDSIKESFTKAVELKYLKGQQEHGGNLFEKEGVLDMALEEVLDLYVYLHTLKKQLEKKQR